MTRAKIAFWNLARSVSDNDLLAAVRLFSNATRLNVSIATGSDLQPAVKSASVIIVTRPGERDRIAIVASRTGVAALVRATPTPDAPRVILHYMSGLKPAIPRSRPEPALTYAA